MAIDKKLRIFDAQGNEQDYDIMATDVKFLPDGKDLPTKLDEMQTSIDNAGQVNEIIMNGQTYTPTNKAIDLGTVITQHQDISGKVDKVTGKGLSTNDFTNELLTKLNGLSNYNDTALQTAVSNLQTALQNVYTKSQTYSKSEVDAAVAEAGSTPGADGVTPHIDQVTGHWFIGNTDTGVSAQGPQGNSGVASGDEVVVVNNLNGNPSDLQEGQVAVLSAEMGKELGLGILAGGGTFADAFDRSREDNVVFPWLLRDVDEDNNNITKMIWHIGNGEFVDAIGSKVNGQKNGLTVVATAPCYMRVYDAYAHNADNTYTASAGEYPKYGDVGTKQTSGYNNSIKGSTIATDYEIAVGENNFALEDIAVFNQAENRYEVSTIIFVDTASNQEARTTVTNTITNIDFGGLCLVHKAGLSADNYTSTPPSPKGLLRGNTSLISVKRLVVDGNLGYALCGCDNLEHVEISGAKEFGDYAQLLNDTHKLVRAELPQLTLRNTTSLTGVLKSADGVTRLHYADIRGIDTSAVTTINQIFYRCSGLKTLIIGNFSTENVTTYNSNAFYNVTGATLVCTTTTPPVFKYDFVNNHFTSIKVPASAETAYKENVLNVGDTIGSSGWSQYASIITTYEEGEY